MNERSLAKPELEPDRQAVVRKLVERLASGRSPPDAPLAEHARTVWANSFDVPTTEARFGGAWIALYSRLPEVRLRGADDVRVLFLLGEHGWEKEARDFILRSPPNSISVLIPCTSAAASPAASLMRGDSTLLLTVEEARATLEAAEPAAEFHRLLLERVHAHHLNPFEYLKPAEGSMFAGRAEALDSLRYETETSFAVPGPGRLGKSSLLRRYRRELFLRRDPRATATFYIDWMDCFDLSYEGITRYLVRHLGGSAMDRRDAAASAVNYLKRQSEHFGQPLTLLCDETDRVCSIPAFLELGNAARRGYCRLVLAGRAELLRWVNQAQSPVAARLSTLRLEPLDPASARALLLEPIRDLGLELTDAEELARTVLQWTGRMPHLIQFYGQRLARRGIRSGQVTLALARDVHAEMETATYLTSVLQDITDPLARLLALRLLRDSPDQISIDTLVSLVQDEGLKPLSHQRAVEIAEELVICNVLIWRGGLYRLSSQSLQDHARRLGYLDNGLDEARRRLHAKVAATKRDLPPHLGSE